MSNPDLRYVFDTNTVVSALLFQQSKPALAFYAALDCGAILLSEATMIELSDVLARKKFDRYLTREECEQFLAMLLHVATIIDVTVHIQECRDPRDDKFLSLAVGGRASCLISGDADLLAMNPFRGIPILTAAQFLDSLPKTSQGDD